MNNKLVKITFEATLQYYDLVVGGPTHHPQIIKLPKHSPPPQELQIEDEWRGSSNHQSCLITPHQCTPTPPPHPPVVLLTLAQKRCMLPCFPRNTINLPSGDILNFGIPDSSNPNNMIYSLLGHVDPPIKGVKSAT